MEVGGGWYRKPSSRGVEGREIQFARGGEGWLLLFEGKEKKEDRTPSY